MCILPIVVVAVAMVSCSRTTDPQSQLQKEPVVISREVLDHQLANDVQVIQALGNAGSDLSKPHLPEHHFECRTREMAEPVLAWGIAEGYAPSPVTEGKFEGREYVYFDLVKSTVLTVENITSETTAMLEIAARHGIEYDGWGCEVVE